jgi:hypothetical protein
MVVCHFDIVCPDRLDPENRGFGRSPCSVGMDLLEVVSLFFGYPLTRVASRQNPASVSPKVFLCRGGVGESGMHKIGFATPVGLEQDAIDVGQLDGFGVVADGLQQRGDA